MTHRTLVLFLRAPQLGTGKRRLAREIGNVAALRFERAMMVRVESTLNVVVNGAGSSSAVPQPSSNATRFSASKRPLSLLAAPRPLRGLTVAGISMAPIMPRL